MEMRSFPASDRSVSVLGYGAWITGTDTASTSIDEAALQRAVRAALDSGITVIDTAEIYAQGRSEEVVGRVVRSVRDDVFVVTKVAPSGAGSGMRPEDVAPAIRASLDRLATDRVDLYLLHWHDPSVPVEETWGAMFGLVAEGLARSVGVSNFTEDLIERCLTVAPVHAVENQLSLLHREDEGLAARLSQRGIGYLAYGALAFGLLSGGITRDTTFGPADWRSGRFARYESNYYEELFASTRIGLNRGFAHELEAVAEGAGVPAAVLALRWVLERPGVTAALVGSTNIGHIRTNALAGSTRLGSQTTARIDELIARYDMGERWTTSSASTRD
jgi:aryl-alcohol dehydrogenase-like predicted oxidoreductase